jgi:hypothetical protein
LASPPFSAQTELVGLDTGAATAERPHDHLGVGPVDGRDRLTPPDPGHQTAGRGKITEIHDLAQLPAMRDAHLDATQGRAGIAVVDVQRGANTVAVDETDVVFKLEHRLERGRARIDRCQQGIHSLVRSACRVPDTVQDSLRKLAKVRHVRALELGHPVTDDAIDLPALALEGDVGELPGRLVDEDDRIA